MKIVHDEGTFLLPESNQINLLVSGNHKKKLTECLENYLVQKKKAKCIIYDEEGDVIDSKKMSYISISREIDYSANYAFKPKSLFNTEFSEIIRQNPERFLSMERARESLNGLTSDDGTYKLLRILNYGLTHSVRIDADNFMVEGIIQMLSVNTEELSNEERLLMICNLMFYLHRDEYVVVYLDVDVNDVVANWLMHLDLSNKYILIDNDAVIDCFDMSCNLIILSNEDFLTEVDCERKEIENVSYLFHPIVLKYLTYQNDIFLKLFQKYADNKTTYFLKTDS